MIKRQTLAVKILTCIAVVVLGFTTVYAEGMDVVGKAEILKGTMIVIFYNTGPNEDDIEFDVLTTLKDQKFYVLGFIPPDKNKKDDQGAYILDAGGLERNCPEHGIEEVPTQSGVYIIILEGDVDDKKIKVKLF